MRKLKLESLQVESFETTASARRAGGTVQGHAEAAPDTTGCGGTGPSYCVICQHSVQYVCEPDTYDVKACGETQYFDCTFGCTQYNSCDPRACWAEENTKRCAID
jgi:hypothetical protein